MLLSVGIDVQVRRGCVLATMNEDGEVIQSVWLGVQDQSPARGLRAVLEELASRQVSFAVGIDAPRTPLTGPRTHSFRRGLWTTDQQSGCLGRHCEVVISSLRLANPQWTPMADTAPDWMKIGFELFRVAEEFGEVHEVFPTASYRALATYGSPRVALSLESFAPGPKDMLDAVISALTVREYCLGRGSQVGGGDGFGTIILPCPLNDHQLRSLVHKWPGDGR
jgi:predicted nuclease with RNAse H fold